VILREALQSANQTLRRAGIDDAFVEAELLLGHVLRMSKAQLYTEPERGLTSTETERLWRLVQRRLSHEPAAHILGHCEFYGIDFCIDYDTFIPRPETELLVEETLEFAHRISHLGKQVTIADVGTGCGAIAVSLALALPQAKIYATDVSTSALQIAEINCQRHRVNGRVELLQGNLLEPLPQPVDMIVANLPYIRNCEFEGLSPEIRKFEPMMALVGGENGLDKIQEMLEQIPGKVGTHGGRCSANFLLEIGQGQGEMVTSLISTYLPQASVELVSDLSGIERVVKVGLSGGVRLWKR
jgi:release factor glutamine methyltransferase